MNRMQAAVAALAAALAMALPVNADETTPLFNGKDLTDWVAEGTKEYKDGDQVKPVWTVKDGIIVCAKNRGFGFLRYGKKEFADFTFHVEYRMSKFPERMANSGIGIRTVPFDARKSRATRPSYAGYEIQLLDDAGKPADTHSSGSLYRYVAPKVNPVKAAPEWNTIAIQCAGPRIRININGQDIIDVDQTSVESIKNKPLKGYVCLQNHGGGIEFRNIRILEKKAPADQK